MDVRPFPAQSTPPIMSPSYQEHNGYPDVHSPDELIVAIVFIESSGSTRSKIHANLYFFFNFTEGTKSMFIWDKNFSVPVSLRESS